MMSDHTYDYQVPPSVQIMPHIEQLDPPNPLNSIPTSLTFLLLEGLNGSKGGGGVCGWNGNDTPETMMKWNSRKRETWQFWVNGD